MKKRAAIKRAGRWLVRLALAIGVFAILAGVAVFLILRTQWIRNEIRTRIIAEAERATGGKVEMQSFDFDAGAMKATVDGFVLRGKEAANDPPLASVGRVEVGVTVVSLLNKKAYLNSIVVEKPRIRIVTLPDGTTNLPGPKTSRADGKTVFEHFVTLAARRFQMKDGTFAYDHQSIPLNLQAKDLRIDFAWDAANARYEGTVAASPFRFEWPKIETLEFATEVELAMHKAGLDFQKATLKRGSSEITASGTLRNYRSPEVELEVDGRLAMADHVREFRLPLEPAGAGHVKGKFRYREGRYLLAGPLRANGLAVRQPTWSIEGVAVVADLRLEPDLVTLSNATVKALDGEFKGRGEIQRWRDFVVRGSVAGLSIEQLSGMEHTQRPVAWSGLVSGPVEVTGAIDKGLRGLKVATSVAIEPLPSRIPVEGIVKLRYEQNGGQLAFESSYVKTPRTRVDFSGSLDTKIAVLLDSQDLNDLLPAAAFVSPSAPEALPVQLDGGRLHFEGAVTSALHVPRITGGLAASNAVYRGMRVDKLQATLDADSGRLIARNLSVQQNGTHVTGDFQTSLREWQFQPEESEMLAHVEIRRATVEGLLQAVSAKVPIDVTGSLTGAAILEGTLEEFAGSAKLVVANATIAGEKFASIRLDLDGSPTRIDVKTGTAQYAGVAIPFRARYEHRQDQWTTGRLEGEVTARDISLSSVDAIRRLEQPAAGRASLVAKAALTFDEGRPSIERLDGDFRLQQLAVGKQPLGGFALKAETNQGRVDVTASGTLFGTAVHGSGEWALRGDAVGLGQIEVDTLTLDQVRGFLPVLGITRNIPFDGSFRGDVVFTGALRKPSTLRARVTMTQLQLQPKNDNQLAPAVIQELTLRNDEPIAFEFDSRGMQIYNASFTGKDTNLQVSGGVSNGPRTVWNLNFRGGLNLGLFQNYVEGLRTSGLAEVNATVRGAVDRPLLGGRMEIRDASVSHRDLTNGLDKAHGVVAFDRNRALLENFTAQSGGGDVKMSGFVAFGDEENPASYRLNSQLERVRIRYPEGASTTMNATLSLTGTADQSLLSGSVMVLRSGFTPRTDIASVLFEQAKPTPTPTTSPLLRGMQFDVRLLSAANLQLETSLTQGVQATVEMRLRGSPSKPVLLGNVSVTQGELNFFGTTYTISRGTVSFFNAARIEPVLDLDLETTVRAVVVNMNVSGPIDKLNVTYRSDPPLQTQDIIALLAVGRTPTGSTVTSQSNITGQGTGLYAGTDALLGQAVSAGLSSRLRRFFGVSRVKIDPQQLGVDTVPQARLTIEQQISRDITLTYVTNLTGALQQLVRLQWDVRRNWSIIGVRDENGVIGADIQFRKRFK